MFLYFFILFCLFCYLFFPNQHVCIPLVTTQGYDGGISIADNYKVSKAFFTYDELQTILTGLKGVDSISKTVQLPKLVEKLSSKNNRIIADDIVVIDLASHYFEPLSQKIDQIKNAIITKQTISFYYYYEKGESLREIEPYRLFFKWSSWYVFGYCLEKEAYRLFKLNRLDELSITSKVFQGREIPDSELELNDYFNADNVFHLKAIFNESEKYRLIDEYGIDCYATCSDRKLLFERDFVSYANMREWIFSFGDKVQILNPKELLLDRLKQAENIIAMRGTRPK